MNAARRLFSWIFAVIVGLAVLLSPLVYFIVIDPVIDPIGLMPPLEGRYWAGYYETTLFGKIWCLARFYTEGTTTKMILLTAGDVKDTYLVDRSSGDKNFIYYTMKAEDHGAQIKAKQLYLGKRYILQRLTVGRFTDFWKRNDYITIRGYFVPGKNEFAIEPISRERLVDFYNDFVLGEEKYSDPEEIDFLLAEMTAIESR